MKSAIFKSRFMLTLFLLSLFPPAYLETFAVLNVLFATFKLCTTIMLLAIGVSDIRRLIRKKYFCIILVLWVGLFISTVLSKDATIYVWITHATVSLAICIFIGEASYRNAYIGISCMYYYFSIIILINTITVFLFPNALYANNNGGRVCWFLGEDNGGYIYYIAASMLAMIYCNYIAKRLTPLSFMDYVSGFLFVFRNDIATGIVCQIVWLILFIAFHFKAIRRRFNGRWIPLIVLGGFVVLVVSRQLILEPIVTALGRSVTLTGRTIVWDTVLTAVQKRPIWGYGMVGGDVFDKMYFNLGIINAHNWLLMVMYWGGVVAVILFAFVLIFACKDGYSQKNTKYYQAVVMGLIVLSVRYLVEAGSFTMYSMFLAMLANSTEMIRSFQSRTLCFKR